VSSFDENPEAEESPDSVPFKKHFDSYPVCGVKLY
jgi:hypothetical protein